MESNLSPQQAKALILKEYPLLTSWDISIEKQFLAGPGRLSNAFLISTKSSTAPQQKFVAKAAPAHANTTDGVLAEWLALKVAEQGSFAFPDLLFPEHRPEMFLLLEFLPGTDAHTAIENGQDPIEIIALIGKTTRLLHKVPAPKFGELNGEEEDWPVYMSRKVRENLAGVSRLITPELHAATAALAESVLPALELESTEPKLIHRDIYLSNFIINKGEAALIDFGMARGGRPLYDLAKFFIIDLYDFPQASTIFFENYFGGTGKPKNYRATMTIYMLRELLGMIGFFHLVNQSKPFARAVKVLEDLTKRTGTIEELLSI